MNVSVVGICSSVPSPSLLCPPFSVLCCSPSSHDPTPSPCGCYSPPPPPSTPLCLFDCRSETLLPSLLPPSFPPSILPPFLFTLSAALQALITQPKPPVAVPNPPPPPPPLLPPPRTGLSFGSRTCTSALRLSAWSTRSEASSSCRPSRSVRSARASSPAASGALLLLILPLHDISHCFCCCHSSSSSSTTTTITSCCCCCCSIV